MFESEVQTSIEMVFFCWAFLSQIDQPSMTGKGTQPIDLFTREERVYLYTLLPHHLGQWLAPN